MSKYLVEFENSNGHKHQHEFEPGDRTIEWCIEQYKRNREPLSHYIIQSYDGARCEYSGLRSTSSYIDLNDR